jgi:hypothetical protein
MSYCLSTNIGWEPSGETDEGRIDPRKYALTLFLNATLDEDHTGHTRAGRLSGTHVLRAMLATTLHGQLKERTPKKWVQPPCLDVDRTIISTLNTGKESASRGLVEFVRRPRFHAQLELLRKARRIGCGFESLAGHNTGGLMLAVPISRGTTEHRHNHLRSVLPNNPHDIGQQLVARPQGERLLGALGKAVVEGPRKELIATIQLTSGQKLTGPHNAQTLPKLRPDQILPTVASGQRKIRRFSTPPSCECREETGVLIVRVSRDHEDSLDTVQLS